MDPQTASLQELSITTDHLAQQLSKVVFENNEEFGRILNEFCNNNAQV